MTIEHRPAAMIQREDDGMFEKIVIPLDGSHAGSAALKVGERLAQHWDVPLEVLSILIAGDDVTDRRHAIERQTWRIRHRHGTMLRPLQHSPSSGHHQIAHEIVDAVATSPNSLVVMHSAGRSRSEPLLHSVAENVIERLDKPAILLGPAAVIEDDWPTGRVLFCCDDSNYSKELGLHAEALSVDLGLPMTSLILTDEHGARHVAERAEVEPTAVLALASSARHGLDRLLHGSLAMDVVHRVNVPVLVGTSSESTA